MKPERELQSDLQRGQAAERLLKDPLMVEVISDMRESVYHNISSSHFKDVEEREDLYKMLQCIKSFESDLRKRIRGGEKAKSLLQQIREKL